MFLDDFNRIKFLYEIFPFINDHSGSTFVIKYGGSAMQDHSVAQAFVRDVLLLYSFGIKVVIIHGGGPSINDCLRKLSIEPNFENGLRVTDNETIEVVEMVLCGKVNKYLVSLLNQYNPVAVGLSGKDASFIQCNPLFPLSNNFVAEVDVINIDLLNLLLSNNYIPIIASIASKNGQTYNINADNVAGVIAGFLKADKLFLLTDTPGIMRNIKDSKTLFEVLSLDQVITLKEENIINGGMIPKVDSCINALSQGARSSYILDGRIKHSLLYKIFTEKIVGTQIVL